MERSIGFPAEAVSRIRGRLTFAQVEIFSGAASDISLLLSGDEENLQEVRMELENGELLIAQPQLAFAKEILPKKSWLHVLIRLPSEWKGDFAVGTLTGVLGAQGISGSEMELSTVSGGLQLKDVRADAMHLHTVSGPISAKRIAAEQLRIRSMAGDIAVEGAAFETAKASNVSGEISLSIRENAKLLEIQTVSGSMHLEVQGPARASLRSLTGRLSRSEEVAEGGLEIRGTSISGELVVRAARE